MPNNEADPLIELVHGSPLRVRQWMFRKARCADGLRPGLQVVGHQSVQAALTDFRDQVAGMTLGRRRGVPAQSVLQVMLLRDLCAMSFAEVARTACISAETAKHRYRMHCAAVLSNSAYAVVAQTVVRRAVQLFLDT